MVVAKYILFLILVAVYAQNHEDSSTDQTSDGMLKKKSWYDHGASTESGLEGRKIYMSSWTISRGCREGFQMDKVEICRKILENIMYEADARNNNK